MKRQEMEDILSMPTAKPKIQFDRSQYLSTGSTMLNLALSGKVNCGFIKGKYFFFVGDSSSGKTWLATTCLAEAAANKNFDDYQLIHDDAEGGANMDLAYYFGATAAERIKAPKYDADGEPVYSQLVEEFYYNLKDALGNGPCVYVLDSMDALTTKYEQDRVQMRKKAHEEGKEASGDYADGKAKLNSSNLRAVIPLLRDTGSILVILNQTRDNLGFGFETKTRSGGRALKFYAHAEMWSSVVKKIEKQVKGKKREMGIRSKIQVKKNRTNGRRRDAEVTILHSYGIDDITSNIEYLLGEKHWTGTSKSLTAPEFEYKGSQSGLVSLIEENGMERALRKVVQSCWDDIEAATAVNRKARYE